MAYKGHSQYLKSGVVYKHTRLLHAMDRSFKWIFSAILLVIGIVLLSRGFANIPAAAQSNVLGAFDAPILSAESLASPAPLRIGSEVEVFRFRLEAEAPFTLRYLSLFVESTGLNTDILGDAKEWRLYTDEAKPQLVGQGERFDENILLLKMSSASAQAYIGDAGKHDFIVMTKVQNTSPTASITIGLSPKTWVWVPYIYTESWVTLQEKWGAEDVLGLPSAVLEKTL